MTRIIDAHCHIGSWCPPGDIQFTVNPVGRQLDSISRVRQYVARNELAAVIGVPHYAPGLDETSMQARNRFLVEVLDAIPEVFGGLLLSPDMDAASTSAEIEHLLAHGKIVAIKLAPNSWSQGSLDPESWTPSQRRRMEHLMQRAVEGRLVLQTHTGSGGAHPRTLSGFLAHFGRDVDLHCVHMGGSASGHFAMVPQFCEWLERGMRVFCDFSLARPFASRWVVEELHHRALPLTNLLFASDEPWGSLYMELCRIHELDLSDNELASILGGNAERLYLRKVHHP